MNLILTVQTLLTYTLLFAVVFCSVSVTKKKSGLVLATLFFSVLFAVRYGVGVDFFPYKRIYEDIVAGYSSHFEQGFLAIMHIPAYFKLPSEVFFGFIAFLQFSIIFFTFANEKSPIRKTLVTSFILMCTWLSFANGLRQTLVMCAFFAAIKLFEQAKYKHLHLALLILFLSFFHKSAFILLVLIPLYNDKIHLFHSTGKLIIYLCSALLIMNLGILDYISTYIDFFASRLGYEYYLQTDDYAHLMEREVSWGIGSFILLAINFVLFYYKNQITAFYHSKHLDFMFNLYVMGCLWNYVFNNSLLLNRINYYMYGCNFIIAAYALRYFYKTSKNKYYVLLSLLFLVFVGHMYGMRKNTCLFIYTWQKDYIK